MAHAAIVVDQLAHTTMVVRIVSGVLAVVVLCIIVWRRKRKAIE